jgi:hypothetical protein
VTGQSGSGEGNPKSSQDDEALRCANILHAKEQTIRAVLKDLDEAVRTADLLEEKQGTGDTPGGGTVTIAADLYSVVRTCRNTVRQISGYLHEKGWSTDDKMRIEKAFGDLAVVWTTYKRVIDQLDYARWGGTPSPDQIWAALEDPRRRYISALKGYHGQLLLVLSYLKPAGSPGAPA